MDVDTITEALRRAGYRAVIRKRPWKRALREVRYGDCAGGFSAFKTPEREQYAHFISSRPLHFSTYVLYVPTGQEFPFHTLEDLRGKRIGKPMGYSISKDFDRAERSGMFIVEEVERLELNILKLMRGRLDALVTNREIMQYTLNRMAPDTAGSITELPVPVQKKRGAYLIISKKAEIPGKAQLIEKLNTALEEMAEDGTSERIRTRYLGQTASHR